MRMYRVLLGGLWLALVVVALSSCNTGEGVTDPAVQFSNLRIANLIPDAPGPLNATVDGNAFVSGLGFEALTPYQQVDSGVRVLQVTVAGGVNNIINTSLTLTGITNYTFVAYGPVEGAAGVLVSDTVTDPGAGNFSLRVISAAAGVPSVDVYVTAPGANLNAAAPNIAGAGFGSVSGFITLPAGTVEIRITTANTKNVIYDSTPQTINERAQLEAIVYTRTSSKLVGVMLLSIDDSGTSSTNPNLLAQFKIINGSSVPSPLNVFVNQSLLLSNIPFGGSSSYQETLAGSPTLSIEATATPGATLLTLTPTLGPGTDSSFLLLGPPGALHALALSDNNLPPVSNRARVRFVNGTNDVSALDVYVNFSRLLSGLAMNSASTGSEFDADPVAGTVYQFDFNVAGTSQSSLKLPQVALFGGRTYTIYVVGSQTALSGIVSGDN